MRRRRRGRRGQAKRRVFSSGGSTCARTGAGKSCLLRGTKAIFQAERKFPPSGNRKFPSEGQTQRVYGERRPLSGGLEKRLHRGNSGEK